MAGAIIGAIIGAGVAEAAATIIGSTIFGSVLLGTVVSRGIGAIAGSLVSSALSSGESPGGQAQMLMRSQELRGNQTANYSPINVIYGVTRVGGMVVYRKSAGPLGGDLFLLIVLGEGEIHAVTEAYADNKPLSTIIGSQGQARAFCEAHLGTDAGEASNLALIQWAGLTDVTSAHKFRGTAYCALWLIHEAHDSNLDHFPALSFDVMGRKLYDPRTATTAWSDNPALVIRDYLTHARYGKGIPESSIDDASFIAAANYCDEIVTIPDVIAQKRYFLRGVLNVDIQPLDNLRDLLTSCRGSLIWSAGKYKLILDRVTAPTFAFTEDNIVGAWQISLGDKRTRYNRVRARFLNRLLGYEADVAVSDSSALRAEDNGLLLEAEVDLPFTDDPYVALQIAQQELKQSRLGLTATFRATLAASEVEVGDVATITHSTPGWLAKPFRITALELLPEGEIQVTVREYADSVYTFEDIGVWQPPPTTHLPGTLVLIPVLTAESGDAQLFKAGDGTIHTRIKVSWQDPGDTRLWLQNIEVQWRLNFEAWNSGLLADVTQFATWISPVQETYVYEIRARYVKRDGRVMDWSPTLLHQVIGNTLPPANVTGLSITGRKLSWNPNTEIDLLGYQIRWHSGSNVSWADANPLFGGYTTETSYTLGIGAYHLATFMVKAVDTSGNQSADVAVIITDLGDPIVANILETDDRKAAGWPGTITGATVDGSGNLAADTTALMWSETVTRKMWSSAPDTMMWQATVYAELAYEDSLDVSRVLDGSQLTAAISATGGPITFEYRISGPGPMWNGNDATPTWDADDSILMYESLPAYQAWPGQIQVEKTRYDYRLRIGGGAVQGIITSFFWLIDAPDITESLGNVSILAAGTRLSLVQTYEVIKVVNLTLQADAGGAVLARVEDKDPVLGPLITCYNASGTAVNGTVDAIIQGY